MDKLQASLLDADTKRHSQEAVVKKVEQAMLGKDLEFVLIEAELRGKGKGRHLEDTLRARKHDLDPVRTNLCATTDLTETTQGRTKSRRLSPAEAREEQAKETEKRSGKAEAVGGRKAELARPLRAENLIILLHFRLRFFSFLIRCFC